MATQINNSHFTPSGGNLPSVKREKFIDYFPRLQERYKGFIMRNMFEGKMKEVIRQAVTSAGNLNVRSNFTSKGEFPGL